MQTKSRKLLILGAILLVLGYAVYRSSGMIEGASFSGAKLLAAVRGANPYLLLLSVCAIYACYALRALRWKLFQQNLGKSRFAPIYAMTLAGFAAIFLLGRAGEPVRPLLLARKQNLPIASITGIYALERIFDLISAAVIAGMALLLEKRHVPVASATGAVLIAAVVLGVAFLAYVRLHGSTAYRELAPSGGLAGQGRGDPARICARHSDDPQLERTGVGSGIFSRSLVAGSFGISLGFA